MCTDQLLLALSERRQIVGLSPFAADAARSFSANEATGLPLLSGTAEEIMVLKPDLVVAGSFTKRATRTFIRDHGIRLEEFAPVRSVEEAKQQILRFGALTGSVAKAQARVAELDRAAQELRAAAASRPIRVLPLARRGWVPGTQTLITDLLRIAGLSNAASDWKIGAGRIATLEAIVALKPDAILIARDDDKAEDQGRALLLHPAVAELFPPERRLVMPERLTVCGGPMLVEAMRTLATEIRKVTPRDAVLR